MDKKKITAILVDDEQDSREVMRYLLSTLNPSVEVIAEAEDIEQAYDLIQKLKPDVVFLDIQLPGRNGFELLKCFDEIFFQIVFITSYDEFAIRAIKFNALDYLLKPIDIEELELCLNKIEKTLNGKNSQLEWTNLKEDIGNNGRLNKIPVHYGDKVKLLELSEILYVQACGRYTQIQTTSNEKYTTSHYLKDFEVYLLNNATEFIRINKSTLINTSYVTAYGKEEPVYIELKHNHFFEVSRRKKGEILQKIKSYFCNCNS